MGIPAAGEGEALERDSPAAAPLLYCFFPPVKNSVLHEVWDGCSSLLPQTRFDVTPAYEKLERLPLAWWGLLRRK